MEEFLSFLGVIIYILIGRNWFIHLVNKGKHEAALWVAILFCLVPEILNQSRKDEHGKG